LRKILRTSCRSLGRGLNVSPWGGRPSFSNQTNFYDEVDLSYPYKLKEPYFLTVFGTFRIQQNYKHRYMVDITADFSFKQTGYVPQIQHSSTSFPQAMSLLGQDIEYWANHTE